MKHSDLKPLVAVDSLNKLTPYDVLITLIESAVKIYTINSSEKKITYDYIEDSNCEDDCTDDVVRVDIVASDFKINRHKHRKIIKLRKNIIIDIAINKQVSEIRLFNSNDKELKMSQK